MLCPTHPKEQKGPNLVLFVICILPGTKSRMTSTQYKTNKRFSWSKLRPTRGSSSANAEARGGRAGGGRRTQGAGRGAGLRASRRSLSV